MLLPEYEAFSGKTLGSEMFCFHDAEQSSPLKKTGKHPAALCQPVSEKGNGQKLIFGIMGAR